MKLEKEAYIINSRSKSNDKHRRILEAAIKVFAEKGFYQSTVSQIAREAGVADGTIYLYFKNKEEILIDSFTYKTSHVFRRFREEVNKADNSIDKLRFLIKRHLIEFQRSKEMAILYQNETHQIKRMTEAKIVEIHKLYLDIIVEIIKQGQKEGLIRSDLDPGLVKRFILGAVDETINTWIHSETTYDLKAKADPLIDLFMNGIGNKKE